VLALLPFVLACSTIDLDDLRGDAAADASDAARAIRCNTTSCAPPSACCAKCTNDAGNCGRVDTCVGDASACTGADDVLFACADPSTCPLSDVCCVVIDPVVHGSACRTAAECGALQSSFEMCDPGATACPSSKQCTPIGNGIDGMYTCQ
jgi:hypothetical protein